MDLRLVGRVHGGVEMTVRATAPAAAALHLRSTSWVVEGRAVESSLLALEVRMHAAARDFCRQQHRCIRDISRRVEQGGWFHLCSLKTREILKHNQLGFAVADWRRADVELEVWVSGRTMSLQISNVDLSDWTRTARRLAEAVVPHAGRGAEWRAVPKRCAAGNIGKRAQPPWAIWVLPTKCSTLPAMALPTPDALLATVVRDNAMIAMREEQSEQWARRKNTVARERYRAGDAVQCVQHVCDCCPWR